ncbi:MAG: DEAD/DEAH box helicase [Cytophagales bacterium]|nr:DEAD/DEAH box helicase [Cytophagales bacterium]
MSFEKLKLNKQLVKAMQSLGHTEPTKVQKKTVARIVGGQELVVTAHEKSGKTTACLLAILKKLQSPQEYDARAILLVPTKEHVLAVEQLLEVLNQEINLRYIGVYSGGGMTEQSDTIFEGIDLIVATPERMAELYTHKGVILRKVKVLLIDGAEEMLERGLISSVHRVLEALPQKFQRVLFTEVYDHRLRKLVGTYFDIPAFVEIELDKKGVEIIETGLYQTPNYRTKQNLIIQLLNDYEWYSKTVIFINTQVTCQNLYKSIDKRFAGEVAVLNARYIGHVNYESIEEFRESGSRILLVLHDERTNFDVSNFPEIFFFDIPSHIQTFADVVNIENYKEEEKNAPILSSFGTPTELLTFVKIESLIGQKVERWAIPGGVIIEGTRQRNNTAKEKEEDPKGGGAFHEKKAKNRKEHNYTYHNPKPSEKAKRKKR